MNVRQVNLTLWSACGVLSAMAMSVLVAAVAIPLQSAASDVRQDAISKPSSVAMAAPPLQAFQPLFARSFRSALDGSNPTAAAGAPAAADAAAPAEIKLIGTVGAALAILKGPDGSDALAELGDDVNGAVIVAIRPSEIDLRNTDGTMLTLHRPAESDTPASSIIQP